MLRQTPLLHIFQHWYRNSVSSKHEGPNSKQWARWPLFKHATFLGSRVIHTWQTGHPIVHMRDLARTTLVGNAWMHCAGLGGEDLELLFGKSSVCWGSQCPKETNRNTKPKGWRNTAGNKLHGVTIAMIGVDVETKWDQTSWDCLCN